MQNNRKGRFPMKKHHVILLLLALLLLLTGCGAGSAAEHAASTPAADARILTALAPGIVVRRVELSDGLLVFGDLVTEFGCSQPPSWSENTRCTITYAETTALLGIDYFATFSVSGLRYTIQACGCCTQEEFIRLVLAVMDAYGE